ncbi:prolyl 3-hydroxylase sudestada1 [Colias croceus]|uniref:prolyl 3-hydroxylase sudestada1 n=1 Tax=Colias crocea TaxID=72248 RepID=UPI001E27FA4B|nr:prolyl 3-hydroxylase sudestada1 [Colias croceus]
MSSPRNDSEEPSSSSTGKRSFENDANDAGASGQQQAAKRRLSNTVIEISDTESDDSDVCAVNSYQASADEVKRIRRDYTSSSSSSSDYSSDSESPWEDDSIVVKDKFETKATKAHLNPRANRMDDPNINPALKGQDVIERLTTHWNEDKDHTSEEVTLTCEPFKLCQLHNFLANPEIINNIVDDMNTLDWTRKKMDLYEFHQTTDLANLTWQRSIRGIYELLKTELKSWVSQVTGIELQGVSASCSLYGPGDHLLIHDDRLTDRRVAFILYLAPWQPPHKQNSLQNGGEDSNHKSGSWCGWSAAMGGALELFARDAAGAPLDVARRVYPANNMLAFFQVGKESFHQVGEVLSMELPRLSINGWFHGPAPPPERPLPDTFTKQRLHSKLVVLQQWVESTYMSTRVRAQVQAQMERASEVCLRDLLQPARAQALLHALQAPDVPWEPCDGRHQRRYERVSPAWLEADDGAAGVGVEGAASEGEGAAGAAGAVAAVEGHAVRALARLAGSAAWARLLADCTDLALTAYCRLELQRWTRGNFTLLPTREQYQEPRLEATLYLGVPEHPLCGGQTVYVAPEEAEGEARGGEALVTVPPVHNALNLVYCDAGAASFTKYLSKLTMSEHEQFYILTCTYSE